MSPIDLSKTETAKIVEQSYQEYNHGLKYREQREPAWNTVEDLYFGKKKKSLITRSVIHVPKMQGTIDVFLSKIDNDFFAEFKPQTEADSMKAKKLNVFLMNTMENEEWNFVDLMGKKEGALYGRAIFKKYATSVGGYTDYFELVDVLDFVIDPLAGGLRPFKYARYCGQDNIIRSIYELKDKDQYDQAAVKRMAKTMNSDRDVDNRYESKALRRSALNLTDAVYIDQKSVRLVEWYTHYKGEKWQVLFSPEFKEAVRVKKLKDVFDHNEFPFRSWAPFPRAHEFWTPGLGELLAEPNKVQNIILSQMLDNNAYRNYGMKAYDKNLVINPADLTPRPMGKVPVNGNPREVIMDIQFPSLDNALGVYQTVDTICARETGVTDNAKGIPTSKRMSAREYVGLLDEVTDRFLTTNKSYKYAMKDILKMFISNVEQFMTESTQVKLLGSEGYELVKFKGAELKDCKFDIVVKAGVDDEQELQVMRDQLIDFRAANLENPRVNQKFLDEKIAKLVGFKDSEIKRLLSPELEGDWETLAEAASENEQMLEKDVDPNKSATTAHIQKHLDFISRTDALTDEQRTRIMKHVDAEIPYAQENAARQVKDLLGGANKIAANMNPAEAAGVPNPQAIRQGSPPAPPNPVMGMGQAPTGLADQPII